MTTLMDFRYKRKFSAEDGANGEGKRCAGKDGEDLLISVPTGTLIRDTESGALMYDMSDGKPFIAAK
jgi:GTP-binding protein